MTAKGWYPDPVDPSINRFWDGGQWTPSTQLKTDRVGLQSNAAPNNFGHSPKGKNTVVWKVCGGAVAFLVVANLISGLGDDDKSTSTAASRTTTERTTPLPRPTTAAIKPAEALKPAPTPVQVTPPAPPVSGLGKPVRDGKFEFVVSSWDATTSTAFLTVTNIGDRPQSVAVSAQYLLDKADRKFEPEFDWTSDLALADLNPGQAVSGSLSYILSGAVPDRMELHDSIFSGGVDVPLG